MLPAMILLAVSCVFNEYEDLPSAEGESTVAFDVEFKPLSEVGVNTRTAGDAIKHINSMWIVVYKSDGTFFTKSHVSTLDSYTNTEKNTSDIEDSAPEGSSGFAESKYCHSTFSMPLPFGKYRVYAVANYDLSSFNGSENDLKSIKLTWNASNIEANNPMFGFFTDNATGTIPAEAPVISIDKKDKSLHAMVRRTASKVTVSFDGSNLNENVYLYIHTVQIKDIPSTCFLGKDNRPDSKDMLIADGETIYYRDKASDASTAGLRITNGVPTGGLDNSDKEGGMHHETANSLFFFENRQPDTATDKGKLQDENGDGVVDNPNGSQESDPDFKDGVKYGSYIEVKGYYINKTEANASQGPIVYRFMLGKDTKKSCDAERSCHFKLVLCFKGDANNPDWHIDYEAESPEISVPSPLYISYGYNEVLNIPIVVRSASANANTTIKAEIIENPWGYPEHKYYNNSNHDDLNDGFLSFENKSGTISITDTERNSWNKEGAQYLSKVKPVSTDENSVKYNIPVYTRPLILGNSLTGHNPYVSYQRKARVRFTVTLAGKTYTSETDVIQVKRLVNPTGIWRSDDNTTPFNVRLMELDEPDTDENGMTNVKFHAPHSDGPWTAHIEEGADWVQIAKSGSGNWGTEDITGGTGTEIRFDYRPRSTNSTGNVRCGVIKVTYHNNTCVHYIFVSQGLGTVNLAGTKWQNRNVLRKDKLVDNPLLEGSMFKFGNPTDAIKVENNYRDGYGFNIDCWGKKMKIYKGSSDSEATFESIGYNLNGFTGTRAVFSDNSATVSTYDQWYALESLHRRYGVMYGDECTETMTTTEEAYSYWEKGQKRGMQGMFVWDESRGGNNVFFPIGSTGYGHRKVNDDAYDTDAAYNANNIVPPDKYSHLKYGQRPIEMAISTSKAIPMYYDIWLRKGGIYWYQTLDNNTYEYGATSPKNGYAHDINFHTMLLQTFGENAVQQKDKSENVSTDAIFIRCVEP